jgi:hypothetical protein
MQESPGSKLVRRAISRGENDSVTRLRDAGGTRGSSCRVHFTLLLESAPRSYSITKPSASIR